MSDLSIAVRAVSSLAVGAGLVGISLSWFDPDDSRLVAHDALRLFDIRQVLEPQPVSRPLSPAAQAAVKEAAALAAKDPLSGYPFALNGFALFHLGKPERAEVLMERARQLEPRTASVRGWLFYRYLVTLRFREAVDEAAVLYHLGTEGTASLSETLAILVQAPEAQTHIVRRLGGTPYFLDVIRTGLGKGMDRDLALELLEGAREAETPGADEAKRALVEAYVSAGDYEGAHRAWSRFWGKGTRGRDLVYDGSFAGLDGEPPFNWVFTNDERVQAVAAPAEGKQPSFLRAEHYEGENVVAGRQLVLLPPGSYQLSVQARAGQSGTKQPSFVWQLTCHSSGKLIARLPLDAAGESAWRNLRRDFEVDASCPAQWLELISSTTTFGRSGYLETTQVSIAPRR